MEDNNNNNININKKQKKFNNLYVNFILSTLPSFLSSLFFVLILSLPLLKEEFLPGNKSGNNFIPLKAESQSEEWLDQHFLPSSVKSELSTFINSFKYLPLYRSGEGNKINHLLFYGPPGTGKTKLAEIFAQNEAYAYCFADFGAKLYSGSSAVKQKKCFKEIKKMANKNKPIVVIIDEIDSIGKKTSLSPASKEEVNELLKLIDKVEQEKLNAIFIGITNYPEELEDALTRSGRFGNKIEFSYLEDKEIEILIEKLESKNISPEEGYKSETNKEKWEKSNQNKDRFVEWTSDYWKNLVKIIREINNKAKKEKGMGISFVDIEKAIDKSLAKKISKDSQKITPDEKDFKSALEEIIENKIKLKNKRKVTAGGENGELGATSEQEPTYLINELQKLLDSRKI